MSSTQLSEPNGSASGSPIHPKPKLRSEASVEADNDGDGDDEEEVFSVTTQLEKDSLISEFRHRKGRRVLPFSSSSTGQSRSR